MPIHFGSNRKTCKLPNTIFSASLIPLTISSGQLLAQAEEVSSNGVQLEEVIVTAQKRKENVQDIPATVNAISAQALDEFSILDFKDVESLAPGVSLQPVDARTQVIVIRGVASDPDNVALAPISPYINHIPVVEQIIFSPLYDMQRMEILRGPQGTLQGRTDPAGSILAFTQRPSMNEWDGYVQQTFTDQPGSNTQFGASLPLIENKLALRIAGLYDDNEGQGYKNITTGQEEQNRSRSGRLTLDWLATDNLEFVLTYTHMKRDTDFPEAIYGDPGNYTTDLAGWNSPAVTDPNYPSSLDKKDREAIHQGVNSYDLELNMTSLHMDWDLGPGSLTWISGYYSFQEESILDRDISNALPLPESQLTDTDLKYYSQELRYTSNIGAFGGFWDYLVGGFWERTKSDTANIVDITGSVNLFGLDSPAGTYTNDLQIPIERTNLSLYTHHTLHFSDSLNLQLGARYQEASIESRADNSNAFYGDECLIPDGTACSDNPEDLTKQEDEGLTGSLKLSWYALDGFMLYGGLDSSYRPPGVTITATPISSANLLFDRETSTAVELGFKSSLVSDRVRLNGSVFYQKFNGYQATAEAPRVYFYSDTGSQTSEQVVGSITFNADTELRGAELELQSLITERWSLGGGAAYTEHHYASGETGPCNRPLTAGETASEVQVAQCDLGGERVSSQPLFFGNIYSEYFVPMGPTEWYIRGLYNHQSERSSYLVEGQSIPSYGVFSLWTGIRSADARWDTMLWAKNLGNTQQLAIMSNREFVDVGPVSTTSNWRRGSMIAPRTVGLTARYNW